ncbi:MAG: phospholipid-binding protein MlaC [Micavibrio sp.]
MTTAIAVCGLMIPAQQSKAADLSFPLQILPLDDHPLPSHSALSKDDNREHLFKVSASDVGAGAENFIDNMAKRALEFLGNSGMSQDQKTESFRRLLNDSFDLETIGRFVLGRYWKTSTEQQRKEYQALFRKMVVDVYAKRFGEYKGQKFETRGHKADNEKDTLVTSFIVPGDGPEVQVEWRVRYKNGRYQIVDVIVEGVSMSLTQRSEFATVIQRGGGDVQVLLAHLKDKQK